MLSLAKQTLFQQLGVFVGGYTVDAVKAVCGGADGYGGDVLDGLQLLVDKSLVQQWEGVDGEPSFTMLETILEYAHGGVSRRAAKARVTCAGRSSSSHRRLAEKNRVDSSAMTRRVDARSRSP